jgi:TRAP-type C4-dicarboxylate transport system substrate-binding protein
MNGLETRRIRRRDKKMKNARKVVYVLLFLCLLTFLVLFSYAEAASQEQVKLRLTCGLPITHFMTEAMKSFKQDLETKTEGLVKVELYPGGELYKHKDVARVLPTGAIEMAICHTGHLSGLHPVGKISGYYFLVKTDDQWSKARDIVMPMMDTAYNKYNIKVLVPLYYGHTALGANKLLREPADIKGLKIRGPTRAHLDCIKAWGATGASLSAGEVYDALGKGAIDGVCTGWSSHATRAHYEVAKYFSGPATYSIWPLIMNLNTWNNLSKDHKEIVAAAARRMEQYTKDMVGQKDKQYIATLEEHANVHFFTPEELSKWTAATKPAYDTWVAECVKIGYEDEIGKIMKALEVE